MLTLIAFLAITNPHRRGEVSFERGVLIAIVGGVCFIPELILDGLAIWWFIGFAEATSWWFLGKLWIALILLLLLVLGAERVCKRQALSRA